MTRTLLSSSLALLLLATGCGASEKPDAATQSASATATATETNATETGDSASADTGDAVATADATGAVALKVLEMNNTGSGPANGALTLGATPAAEGLEIHIDKLSHYCKPAPSFSAEVSDGVLTLTLTQAAQPVSKCFGPFSGKLQVEVAPTTLRSVVLVDKSGKELARTDITIAD